MPCEGAVTKMDEHIYQHQTINLEIFITSIDNENTVIFSRSPTCFTLQANIKDLQCAFEPEKLGIRLERLEPVAESKAACLDVAEEISADPLLCASL